MEFGALNWAIVVAYLVGNLLLGYAMSRKVKTAADYQIGDRSAPWWAIGISVVATYVSALSFLGGPAWAYGDGMAALAIHINYPLVIFVVIVLFLPFFYNSGVASIYEYLEQRFGLASRTVMSAIFLLTQTITTASILTATAVVITFATGIDVQIAIIGMTLVVLVYTMLGGMNAVIWTDVLQGVILFVGAGIVLWGLLGEVSPLSGALDTLANDGKLNPINTDLDFSVAPTVWAGVLAMTLFHITVYGTNQMMVQRALAAKTLGDAKKSYLMMGFAAFFIYFLFFFIGALLYVHFKGEPFEQPNEIILVFAQSLAIPGLMGILAAAVLSASMSSLSSALNSLATISVTDFYQRFYKAEASTAHFLAASRAFTVVWAVLAVPIAFAFINSGGSILERLSQVASYFVGAKLAMFGLGFLSKHTTERGLLVGVGTGFLGLYAIVAGVPILGLEPATVAWPWYVVIGGVINIAVSWTASVLLDGFQKGWHPQTVVGQLRRFKSEGLPEKQDGWYVAPGRVDNIAWYLLGFFVLIVLFLAWFGTLGGA
ncbi:MAG: sodium/solute symporter [Henriciella sp.]|nr:sodium/solute symporter [Henriciella sp.]MBO6695683.1 sodium/solute symporter [Henriciella sp.]